MSSGLMSGVLLIRNIKTITAKPGKKEQRMKKTLMTSLLLAAGLTVATSQAFAGEQESKAQDTAVTEKALAISALDNMSEYLRSLDKFTLQGNATVDEVLPNGQKVQLSRSLLLKADPPSSLWAKTSNMYSDQEFFFDGKTFTISTPELGYYASFDAPATIGEVIVKARDTFKVELPLSDLFLWREDLDAPAIDEAIIVGVDQINGITCNQFAFREKEVDWQIWIQRGDTPLPLKLVITSKEEESQPQYAVVLKWNTASALSDQSYTFTPADGDHKINLEIAEATK